VQASASHSKYTEDDVRNKTFDYFAAGYGLNLNDRIGIQNIVSADLVKINYSEAESNVDDIEKFYVEAYASFYTGPTERYLQGFMDEQTKVYAEVPVVIKPNLQYKPYYSGLTATALALCEDGDDIALEDDEGCVLTDEDTVYDSNPSVLIAHKTSVTPFIDRVYSFMPKGLDVVPDEEYTHMLDIRDAYDLKNNYGVDVLSILFNFELSDISISDAED